MSEIRVGDYIRTKQGYIAKVTSIDDEFIMCDEMIWCYYEETSMLHITAENEAWGTINSITKHSHNIIDLIEVGDMLNKNEVIEVKDMGLCIYDINNKNWLPIENIDYQMGIELAIVTHEQMERMEYKVNA